MALAVVAGLMAAAMPLPVHAASSDPACTGQPTANLRETLLLTGARLRQNQPIRVLAIGSSSTQGAGATSPAQAYPARLRADLDGLLGRADTVVVNAGIGGETAQQTVERLEKAVAAEHFHLVIWQVGTNDAVRGENEERFRGLLARGIASVEASGADLMLIDQQFFPTVKDPARYEHFVGALNEVAAAHNVPVFRRYGIMQGWALRSRDDFRTMLAGDQFHMSDRGYACIASLIAQDIAGLARPAAIARVPRATITAPRP